MAKIPLDEIDHYEDTSVVEKFSKKKQSDPKKKHNKNNKKHRENVDVE